MRQAIAGTKLYLEDNNGALTLSDGTMTLTPDFTSEIPRLSQNRLNQELLIKAAKLKNTERPVVIDATAGLGEDSFLLAAAGFSVELYETNSAIADLLENKLERASRNAHLRPIIDRMTLHKQDSVEAMHALSFAPDVILLDPMFPNRTKSAAVKKKFQLLHQLESPCTDEEKLLKAALAAKPRKIIIKRPPKGPHLANRKPSYSLQGKAIRYDIIAIPRN